MVSSPSAHGQMIFVSYLDKDIKYLDTLKTYMSLYLRNSSVSLWARQDIKAGAKRDEEVKQAIEQSDAAIVLVNAEYLANESVEQKEIQPLLKAAEQRRMTLVPILLGPHDIERSPFAEFEPPYDRRVPLSSAPDKAQWWVEVAKNLHRAILVPLEEKSKQASSNIDISESIDEVQAEPPEGKQAASQSSLAQKGVDEQDLYERYKGKLLGDEAGITRLQILKMSNPLAVSDIYIKVRLHKNPRPRMMAEPEATKIQDPLLVMEQRQSLLEQRSSTAIDPAFALKQYRRCVIVGDPGAGKTTLLKRLTVQSLQEELPGLPTLPIYVKLNEAARASWDNLLDFVVAGLQRMYGLPEEQIGPFLERKLSNGEAILLLDALDEAVIGNDAAEAEASYKRVADEIQRLSRRYPVPIIVTARKAGYFQRSQLTSFTELEVLDFLPTEIDQFIKRWFTYYGEESRRNIGERLISDLKKRPYIATLAANPLLLTLLIITYESNDQQFPDNRARLYRDCIDTFLKNWDADANRFIGRYRYFSTDTQEQLLAHIAGYFHERRRSYFSEEELLEQISEFLESIGESPKQAPEILQEITSENGLLREQAQKIYGFLHLTLQEYFTAEYLIADSILVEQLLTHLADPWWEEVILLFAGQTHDAGSLLTHLVAPATDEGEVPEDIFSSKLILSGRCLAAHPRVSKPYAYLRQEIPDRLFDELSYNEYSLVREHAAEVLAEIGRAYPEGEVNDRLVGLLEEGDSSSIKVSIFTALGQYGSRTLGSKLLTLFLSKSLNWMRRLDELDIVEMVLGNLCDESILPRLFTLLSTEEVLDYNNVDIAALIGRIGGSTVISRLSALLNDTHIALEIRYSIPPVLGQYGDVSVIQTLVHWLNDADLANYCADGLLLLNDPSTAHYLISALYNPQISLLTRRYIATLLANLADSSQVQSLTTALFDEKLEVEVREAIASTLVTIGDDELHFQLLSFVEDERLTHSIQVAILHELGQVSDSTLIPRLQQLRRREYTSTELYTVLTNVLGMLGDYTVFPETTQQLQQTNPFFSSTRYIVNSIAKYESATTLIKMLANTDVSSFIRQLLAITLNERKELARPVYVQKLLDIVADRRVIYSVRASVTELVGHLAYDERTVERLADLLPTSDLKQEMHRTLWAVSRRAGVMVVGDGVGGEVRVVRQQT